MGDLLGDSSCLSLERLTLYHNTFVRI